MTDFIAYSSRWRIALLILIALAFVTLGLWMGGTLGLPPASRRYPETVIVAIGWFNILFFGMCAVIWMKRLFEPQDQLRVGPLGICWKPWSEQTIPWSEVLDVTTWNFKRQNAIVLHLLDRTRFPGRGLLAAFTRANRILTGGDIAISMTGTDRSFAEALAAIEQFRIKVR